MTHEQDGYARFQRVLIQYGKDQTRKDTIPRGIARDVAGLFRKDSRPEMLAFWRTGDVTGTLLDEVVAVSLESGIYMHNHRARVLRWSLARLEDFIRNEIGTHKGQVGVIRT